MRNAMNDTYYQDLGSCVPMTRDKERERGAEMARLREARDRLAETMADREDEEISAEEHLAMRKAQRAYEKVRNEFVRANLRLVVKIASQYNDRRLPLSDLIQEGNIGLMTAVDRFDTERGVRFCTYAAWWIRHRVSRALVNHGRAVRVPNHIAQTSSKLLKQARKLEKAHGRAATVEELAAATDLPVKKVRLALQTTNRVLSLDASAHDDERSIMATLADDATSSLQKLQAERRDEAVARVLEDLDPVEADILRKRFAFDVDKPLTLREIGAMHSLSRERIRQIQNKALAKMRRQLDDYQVAS